MADDPDNPPRKFYDLKPREFDRVNAMKSEPSTEPTDVQALIRAAQARPGAPLLSPDTARPPVAPTSDPNDVAAVLLANLHRENEAGLNAVKPPRPFRKRRRDFLVLMIAGNLFIAGLYSVEMLFGFQVMCMAAKMPQEFGNLIQYALANPGSYAMALVGMVFFSGCITWLLYGVMDNY